MTTVETFVGKPQLTYESIIAQNERDLISLSAAAMGCLIFLHARNGLGDNPFLTNLVKEYIAVSAETRDILMSMYSDHS